MRKEEIFNQIKDFKKLIKDNGDNTLSFEEKYSLVLELKKFLKKDKISQTDSWEFLESKNDNSFSYDLYKVKINNENVGYSAIQKVNYYSKLESEIISNYSKYIVEKDSPKTTSMLYKENSKMIKKPFIYKNISRDTIKEEIKIPKPILLSQHNESLLNDIKNSILTITKNVHDYAVINKLILNELDGLEKDLISTNSFKHYKKSSTAIPIIYIPLTSIDIEPNEQLRKKIDIYPTLENIKKNTGKDLTSFIIKSQRILGTDFSLKNLTNKLNRMEKLFHYQTDMEEKRVSDIKELISGVKFEDLTELEFELDLSDEFLLFL